MTDLIGQRLGQYEIVSVLGRGGMSTVYRARQVSVNREVAVKVINKNMDGGDNFAARFSREAQTVAQLSHPHILKLFDYGQEGETLYLIMELLSGGSLNDLIRQGPLPLDQVDRLLTQIALALDYAHQQGVIHRDLKPHNVLMDLNGNAYLTDFGLARLVADSTRLTQTGLAIGTPAYMPPEAWQNGVTDSRSDLYSLGVMLYEMLTGDLPFQNDSPYKLMFAHVNDLPPHVTQLPPEFSLQIDIIVQQALAKDPADRQGSATEMATAFHAALTGDKVTVPVLLMRTQLQANPKKEPAARILRVSNRRWLLVAGGISLLILIVAALAILTGRPAQTTRATQPPVAGLVRVSPVAADENIVLVAQLQQLGRQPRDVTRFIVQNLTDSIETGVPFSKLRIREYPQVITSDDQARAAAQANHAWVVVWGSASDKATDLQVQVGDLSVLKHNKIPEDVIRRSADVHVRLTDPQVQSVAEPVLVILNTMQGAEGNPFEDARIISLLDQLKANGNSAEVIANSVAAQFTRVAPLFVNDTQKFIDQMQPIIDLDANNPLLYLFRGMAYFRLQQFDQGLQDAETAKRLGPEGWIMPIFMLAYKDYGDKHYDDAITLFGQMIQLNPADWVGFAFRAVSYYYVGKFDAARTDLDAALALGPNSNVPYAMAMLLALRQGRMGDARALMKTVLQKFPDPTLLERIFASTLGDPDSSKVTLGLLSEVGSYLLLAQFDRVLKDTDQALKIDPTLAEFYFARGFADCNLSKLPEAEAAYTQGIKYAPDFALLYVLRAEVRKDQGNLVGALSDVAAVRQVKGSDEVMALVNASSSNSGSLSCKNFLTGLTTATPAR